MRKAVGLLILIYGMSYLFKASYVSIDRAGSQIAQAIGTAAAVSERQLLQALPE